MYNDFTIMGLSANPRRLRQQTFLATPKEPPEQTDGLRPPKELEFSPAELFEHRPCPLAHSGLPSAPGIWEATCSAQCAAPGRRPWKGWCGEEPPYVNYVCANTSSP